MLLHFRGAIKGARDCKNRLSSNASLQGALNRVMVANVAVLFILALCPSFGLAKGLDPAALLKPPTDTWPTYNGDYSGRRYSTLDQIHAGNVGSLGLAWIYRTRGVAIKS